MWQNANQKEERFDAATFHTSWLHRTTHAAKRLSLVLQRNVAENACRATQLAGTLLQQSSFSHQCITSAVFPTKRFHVSRILVTKQQEGQLLKWWCWLLQRTSDCRRSIRKPKADSKCGLMFDVLTICLSPPEPLLYVEASVEEQASLYHGMFPFSVVELIDSV